jgi:hypothetical protein
MHDLAQETIHSPEFAIIEDYWTARAATEWPRQTGTALMSEGDLFEEALGLTVSCWRLQVFSAGSSRRRIE